jgi:hypothetical protein
MKVVIADTSPLNYLILTGSVDVLPRLYKQVLIPDEVASELADSGAPPVVLSPVLWACFAPPHSETSPLGVRHKSGTTRVEQSRKISP